MNTQTISRKPTTRTAPVVGMGATLVYPTDRYPKRIVKVSDSGHAIWTVGVRSVDTTTGHLPSGTCNGFPVWNHTYTDTELDLLEQSLDTPVKATRRKDGTYRVAGSEAQIAVGTARYYRNFAD